MDDLQNRGAIVFRDRFFDSQGRQIQDMQVSRDHLPATVLMANAMNTSKELDDLLALGDIPRLLNQELKESKPPKQTVVKVEPTDKKLPPSSYYKEESKQSSSSVAPPTPAVTNLGKRKDEHLNSPPPTLALAQGLVPMAEGEILHPFAPQSYLWDDLWREQDGNAHFIVVARRFEKEQAAEADRAAVREVCTFFMRMKKHTSLYQQKVDWHHPGSLLAGILDKAAWQTANAAMAAPFRKGTKQQRRSSTGLGHDSSELRSGLAVEWNLEIGSSWVWNDNQEGAARSDPKLLTRLLQKAAYLPDESDYLAEGKTDVPIDMLTSTYKKFLVARSSSFTVQKGGKGKGKASKFKARWLPQETPRVPEEAEFDLLMLPHPTLVNREHEAYILTGPGNLNVGVTKENWETLRFNTKTFNPEYFPASYLRPVPTISLKDGHASAASFPRSTINGTLEDFRLLLLAPVLTKNKKISPEVYRALSLDTASGAISASDRATAPKRIATFLRLCATFIPCDHVAYDQAVFSLDAEVDADVERAKAVLASVEEQHLPAIIKLQDGAVSVLLQVLYALYQGRVQFLMGDYKTRVIEAHGREAFPSRTSNRNKDRPPRVIQDVHVPAPKLEQARVDLTNEEDGETTDDQDTGSSQDYTSGGEEDKANTRVPSAPQQEATRSQMGTSTPLETTEAAGFGSDTSSRKEADDNDELGQAEAN